jgi:mannose-6-phosphate isomerase-like protein (cupin superfamily)
MMLSAQVLGGEVLFTVTHLKEVQSLQPYDGFHLAPLAQTPDMNIRLNRLVERIKPHTHPHTDHFLYFIQGQIELTVGQATRLINAGDFVTIPHSAPHSMRRLGPTEVLILDISSPPDTGDVIWHE